MLTTPIPIIQATTVMITYISTTLPPIRLSFCTSPIAAIPLVKLKKITGTISILIRFIKSVPAGFTQIEKSLNKRPAAIPKTKPIATL